MKTFCTKSIIAIGLCLFVLGEAAGGIQLASAEAPAIADASQMTTVEEVVEEGMTPVPLANLLDGDYPVEVKSSSSMFRIVDAVLHVESENGMELTMTMSGKGYLYVYPGTAQEAATGNETDWVPYVEDMDGSYTFTIPVEELDVGFPCAAFSKNKELWYDRMLLVRADSLPMEAFHEGFFVTAKTMNLKDGSYICNVMLTGGSGRASITSPARLKVSDGACEAIIIWSSKNYDYMKVGDEQIMPLPDTETSTFRIPVRFFDRPMAVIADTVAMSEPHEISYSLRFDSESIEALS